MLMRRRPICPIKRDEVSVTNLKEALRTPALTEPEFITLSTVGAYIRAARDGLTGVDFLFSKDIQV